MSDYRAEIERRIRQFHRYLEPMDHRAHEEAHSSSFLIFENRQPGEDPGREMWEQREPALAAVAEAFGESGDSTALDEPQPPNLPDEGWREEGSPLRFVQFAFQREWFCVGLPRQTISFDEALEMLWHDRGFFYLRDKPQFTLSGEPEGYDPFRKVYLYGDEEEAAEDTAFVFFRVWGLPVDSRLYVTAASFGGEHEWERGIPIG